MKTLDEVRLENMIWLRELMRADNRDTLRIDIEIKDLRLMVEDKKLKGAVK